MTREFNIDEAKPSFAQWHVEIDLTDWLDTDKISSVAFSAQNVDVGGDASTVVLDPTKNTFTDYKIYPFIRGGVSGVSYRVKCQVTTDSTDIVQDEFYVNFSVEDVSS